MKLITTLITALPFALGATALQAQTVTLKVSHYLGSNHNFHTQVLEPWCAELDKDSGGKLKCQIYPALQLGGTVAQLPDQVKNGVADIAWVSPSFSTGRFPRSEALELPFTLPRSSLGGSLAMWDYTQKYAMDDFKDFKVLSIWSGSGDRLSYLRLFISSANGVWVKPGCLAGPSMWYLVTSSTLTAGSTSQGAMAPSMTPLEMPSVICAGGMLTGTPPRACRNIDG